MNIALMLESDGPGGAEKVLVYLAEGLRERGHAVFPVGPADGCGWLAAQFRERGFSPETFAVTRRFDPSCVRGLGQLFKQRSIDVVHSHEFGMAVYGGVASAISRRPHVITMHGGRYYDSNSRRRAALRWALRFSRAGVAVSRATRAHIEESLGLPSGSLHVVYNGMHFDPGDRSLVRAELGLADDALLIVAIGNLYEVKGHAYLIRALKRLGSVSVGSPHLAIAGRGEEEGALRSLTTELGIDDRVHFLGFRDDVKDILAAADVYAMPSLSEGHPLALLEAMFARKAIIASAVGGIPEVVSSGETAVLVPPGDSEALAAALPELLANSKLRTRLAEAAHRHAQSRFSVQAMAEEYERIYATGSPACPTQS